MQVLTNSIINKWKQLDKIVVVVFVSGATADSSKLQHYLVTGKSIKYKTLIHTGKQLIMCPI